MDAMLLAAFRKTLYRVLTPRGELVLRIDRREPGLATLLQKNGASCAALLTAFNPEGRRTAPFRNRRAQQRLHAELVRTGRTILAGRNEDPRRRWPTEPSLLALDLELPEARRIAARYRQAALLWMEADGTPRLVETAARPPRRC